MASYKKSRDKLQLGLVQAINMITTMHFIHPWAPWQLQIERHSACPASYEVFCDNQLKEKMLEKDATLTTTKVCHDIH